MQNMATCLFCFFLAILCLALCACELLRTKQLHGKSDSSPNKDFAMRIISRTHGRNLVYVLAG